MKSIGKAAKFWQVFAKTSKHLKRSIVDEKRKGAPLTPEELDKHMTAWAAEILATVSTDVHITGHPPMNAPGVLVGNHVSYLDIPLMMSIVPTVFVSKAEVAKWPVVGAASKRIGTVLVERHSPRSRVRAVKTIRNYLENPTRHLTLFPAGTTSMTEHREWRWGIFEIAAQVGVQMQPFRLRYSPMRQVAYIDNDMLVPHLWQLLGVDLIQAFVEFGEPFYVTCPQRDAQRVREWTRQPLLSLEAASASERSPDQISGLSGVTNLVDAEGSR